MLDVTCENTSERLRRFCVLCCYGITHTDLNHLDCIRPCLDSEFLYTLEINDLIPTQFGVVRCGDILSWNPVKSGSQEIELTCIVEYLNGMYTYNEQLTIVSPYYVNVHPYIRRTLPENEQKFLNLPTIQRPLYATLWEYRAEINKIREGVVNINEEIEKQIEYDNQAKVLLDWLS